MSGWEIWPCAEGPGRRDVELDNGQCQEDWRGPANLGERLKTRRSNGRQV
jgi:hypothetical protein